MFDITMWQKLLDGLALISTVVASVMMVTLISVFGWLVYGRYVLNQTPTWVEQVALLLIVWITFLGAAVGIRHGSHLAVDFILNSTPPAIRKLGLIICAIALIFFGIMLSWQGYEMFERVAQRRIPLLGISEAWRAVPVIISGLMITVFAFDELISRLFNQDKKI
jgi:TRAP-type C4-dicarboxylate transport system permease small subunit